MANRPSLTLDAEHFVCVILHDLPHPRPAKMSRKLILQLSQLIVRRRRASVSAPLLKKIIDVLTVRVLALYTNSAEPISSVHLLNLTI